MPQLYIPNLGDELILSRDWTFRLFNEYRNKSITDLILRDFTTEAQTLYPEVTGVGRLTNEQEAVLMARCGLLEGKLGMGLPGTEGPHNAWTPVTIMAGSVLKISRIYIRLGQDYFNSVTFTASKKGYTLQGALPQHLPHPMNKGIRFWAKLEDVNTLEFHREPGK